MPELVGFTMEFDKLEYAQKVALKELVGEVQEMKKNLDTVLDERDKQRDNFIIFRYQINLLFFYILCILPHRVLFYPIHYLL